MKTYVEDDELTRSDTEITLGTRSILGIFFGLALICGVFFGFGYSVGRANISRAAASMKAMSHLPGAEPSSAIQTVVEDQDSSAAGDAQPGRVSDSGNSLPKPSGALAESQPAAASPDAAGSPAAPQQTAAAASDSPAPASSASRSAPVAAAVPVSYSPPQASAASFAAGSANIMVQIAAVSRREDADVLVTALGRLNYHASIRTSSGDSLLHVQIGPFATRDQAKAMRTKLLNDGYNAILK